MGNSIKKHVLAYAFGKGGAAFFAFAVTPCYVRFLGIESYGLIGFYTAIVGFFFLFDFGLGDTFCREAARLFSKKDRLSEIRTTFRTLEILYWLVGAILAIILIIFSPLICECWLNAASSFSHEKLCLLVRLMALSLFFLWPTFFYTKGLQGLQAHYMLNCTLFFGSLFRYVGTLLIIYFFPKIEIFFYWQILSSFFQTFLALVFTWKKIALFKNKARFSLSSLSNKWKFSLGMSGIGITSVILFQADKIIISRFFSLEMLGFYCFSFTLASSLYYLIQPLAMVYYPLFIQYFEEKEEHALKNTYHISCQLLMLVVCPFALMLIFFSKHIVILWTANRVLAEVSAPLISILTLGMLFNCFMLMPFYAHIACGKTRDIVLVNIFSSVLLAPAMMMLSKFFGLFGAAAFFAILNGSYLIFFIPILHITYLKNEIFEWYKNDFFLPFIVSGIVAYICHCLIIDYKEPIATLITLIGFFSIITLCTLLATPIPRKWILTHVMQKIPDR